MMDPTSETRLQQVFPVLAERVRAMAEQLAGEGIDIRVVQGLRTWAEQTALYAQGRTTPGNIVTEARAGYSWHEFGLAVDIVPMNGPEPMWNNPDIWDRIIAAGEVLGLTSGKAWHDVPHFQLTGKFPATPTDEVRR